MILVANELVKVIEYAVPLLGKLPGETVNVRPAPDKWSVKEILGHLIDSAANNHQKFIRTMQHSMHNFPIYEQDNWVNMQNYNDTDWKELIALWEYYNRHLAHIMRQVSPQLLQNQLTISGKGPFTLQFIIPDYVEHLKHHLKTIFKNDPVFDNNFNMVY